MEARDPHVSRLNDALPAGFDFYHLGNVRLLPGEESAEAPLDSVAVGFTLQGETRGLLVLFFDRGLDLSTYVEMGNVIGSRMATTLGAILSPPRMLEQPQLEALARAARTSVRRGYAHVHQGKLVTVQAWILPVPSEGTGYA
jgi:hypothetical protein